MDYLLCNFCYGKSWHLLGNYVTIIYVIKYHVYEQIWYRNQSDTLHFAPKYENAKNKFDIFTDIFSKNSG